MTSKFIVEVKGSVSQRMYQFDTKAAQESTHQSRADYLHRKQAVLARPSWMQHASSSVNEENVIINKTKDSIQDDSPAAKKSAAAAAAIKSKPIATASPPKKKIGVVAHVPIVTEEQKLKQKQEEERHAAALKLIKQKEHPPRGNLILSRKAIIEDVQKTMHFNEVQRNEQQRLGMMAPNNSGNNNNNKNNDNSASSSNSSKHHQHTNVISANTDHEDGIVKMFTSKGLEKVRENDLEWRIKQKEREQQQQERTTAAPPQIATKNQSLTRAPRKREGAPTQPLAMGDILGKQQNITKTMIDQRNRFDQLERERLNHMRGDLESHGFHSSVSPGGPAKRITERIYAGLPKQLNAREEEVFQQMKEMRGTPESLRRHH